MAVSTPLKIVVLDSCTPADSGWLDLCRVCARAEATAEHAPTLPHDAAAAGTGGHEDPAHQKSPDPHPEGRPRSAACVAAARMSRHSAAEMPTVCLPCHFGMLSLQYTVRCFHTGLLRASPGVQCTTVNGVEVDISISGHGGILAADFVAREV